MVTLASIVEREAEQSSERPTIASVYLNNWPRGLPLQLDPDCPVRGRDTRWAQAACRLQLLGRRSSPGATWQIESLYDTYPDDRPAARTICNPGELDPRLLQRHNTADLFVADTDGTAPTVRAPR